MMFCLLYGMGSMGAKKSLEREIRESDTLSEWGQSKLFLPRLLKESGNFALCHIIPETWHRL